MMANNNSHHLNMHQHQLHSAAHHLSPHLQHQQQQQSALQQAHVQQQQQLQQHSQLIAQHQLNNQTHSQHHNLTSLQNSHFASASSPYGSDKSGDISPNSQNAAAAAYLEQQHNLHNEQLLNATQNHNRQHNLQQLHYNRANLTQSPQSSPSSSVANLHSPTNSTSLIQNLVNSGVAISPANSPSVHCDEQQETDQQTYNQQQQQQLHQQHNLANHPHLSFTGNASNLINSNHHSNQGQTGSLLSKLSSQPITVLQNVNSAANSVITQNNQQALRNSTSSSCTNNLNSNLINLASAIVSTPVVTNSHQQQLAIDCKPKLQNLNNSTNSNQVGSSTNHLLNSPNGGSNSATSTADEGEEINTKELAQRISAELKRYSIPQG